MKQVKFSVIILSCVSIVQGQNIGDIVERVYQANEQQEKIFQTLYPYSYHQKILFQKFDSDGDIDEQSRREYLVQAISENTHKRELIEAWNFEDGEWQEVTEEEKENDLKGESKKFSLNEMVGPETRDDYLFKLQGNEQLNGYPVYRISVQVKEPDDEKFAGELWVRSDDFIVVKATLNPSELPAAVDTMTMEFEMANISGYWLPAHVRLDAEISFLFFFSGRIKSDIVFYDYVFSSP